jgi:ASC-1-like (ASCH) protein
MDHVAIMKKSWGLTEKILSGRKKIESRWYLTKRVPWNNIKAGETVYFKDSGEPVKMKAEVSRVEQFADLTPRRIKAILNKYGRADGLEKNEIPNFFKRFKDKRYCLLIFLKNPAAIKPFEIDKAGFGNMAAWLTVDKISKIKRIS